MSGCLNSASKMKLAKEQSSDTRQHPLLCSSDISKMH